MSEGNKSYQQGLIDGVKLWGSGCGKQTGCDVCPIGVIREADMSCQEFARQFPEKFVSMLTDMESEKYTYANEYNLRMPNTNLTVEQMVDLGMCRKMIFEGYTDCEETDCESCWNEQYIGDITEEHSDKDGIDDSVFEEDAGEDFNIPILDEDF